MKKIFFLLFIIVLVSNSIDAQDNPINYTDYDIPSVYYLEYYKPEIFTQLLIAKKEARKIRAKWNYKDWYVRTYILSDSANCEVANRYKSTMPTSYNYYSPGDELEIASNHYYSGLGLQVSGVAVYLISNYVNNKHIVENTEPVFFEDAQTSQKVFNVISGALVLVGVIYELESFSHIKNAGLLLNENGIGVKINLNSN